MLWAFERHLDGRRDHALYLGVAAALLRPEAWPFLGALRALAVVLRAAACASGWCAFAVLVPAVLDPAGVVGADDPLRAGSRANAPNPGSAAFAAHPALELFKRFTESTVAPVELGTLIAVGVAAVAWWRRRAQGAGARARGTGLLLVRARGGDDGGGFAGNQRYLMVTTAACLVLGGVGAVRVLQGVEVLGERWFGRPRAGARAAAVALVTGFAIASPTIVAKADNTGRVQGGIEHEAYLWHDLKALIDANGGKERCSPAAAYSAVPSRPRWSPTSSACTGSTWAGRSPRRRASPSARARCRTARS